MYARVTTYQIRPGQIEERLRHGRDVSTPSRKQQVGARGFLNLVDRHANKNVSISLWDTADDMLAAERHDDHFKRLSHHRYAAGDITQEHFEVAAVRRGPAGALPTGRYACVRTYWVRPGKIEERLHHGREVTYPAVRQFAGFRGALVLVDRATHKNVTITVWDNEAQMLALERNEGYARMRQHAYIVGEVSTEYFEVARHD
jgi:heme-degrading monooxygenase HmoA